LKNYLSFPRKFFNNIDEVRNYLIELKRKYGKKNSKFIVKTDTLGIIKMSRIKKPDSSHISLSTMASQR